MTILLLLAAGATPVAMAKATVRIVSAAKVTQNGVVADNRLQQPSIRTATDPANGQTLRLAEFQ